MFRLFSLRPNRQPVGGLFWRRATPLAAFVLLTSCATREHAPCSAPAAGSVAAAPPAIEQVLSRACYDCHATGSETAWNAKLSPSYWFAGGARDTLNFSQWSAYDNAKQLKLLDAIAKVVRDGEMPPWDYALLHRSGGLTDSDARALSEWAAKQARPAH